MSPSEVSLVGLDLAGYRIESLLGAGGMSEVYAARHLLLDRAVALKILDRQLARQPGFRERFLRESRLASSLDHPNVVRVYEAGEEDGILFIAMQYVDGPDLRVLLEKEGALRPTRTHGIVSQTARALDAAHRVGLVHRDVKPANILLAPREGARSERVFLSDFGLTRYLASDSRYTASGHLVGSVHYMAPEQIEGKPVDARADVYSLGCVLYECLTGRPPYERDSDIAVLWAHVQSDIPSVTAERPELPDAIDAVVEAALAKSPDDRFQSASELAKAARKAFAGERTRVPRSRARASTATAVTVEPAGAASVDLRSRPSGSGVLRNLKAAIVAATVVLAGGASVMVVARTAGMLDSPPPQAAERPVAAPDEQEEASDRPARGGARRTNDRGDERVTRRKRAAGESADAALGQGLLGTVSTRSTALVPPPRDLEREGLRITRSVTESYGPETLANSRWDDCLSSDTAACVDFFPREGEAAISVMVEDSNSRHVVAKIRQDIDGDRRPDGEWKSICNESNRPITLAPGAVVNVMLVKGGCNNETSTPTTGEIRVTFYKRG